jgi:hypothetical protein
VFIAVESEIAADWQYTNWEMEPTEVVAASEGTAVELTDSEKSGAHKVCHPPSLRMILPGGVHQVT